MDGKFKYYVILHLVVLIFGFTGILGDQINLSAEKITFFRTGISFISLLLLGFFIKNESTISKKDILKMLLIGGIVGLHWYSFFHAIKVSNVSIALVCMASSSLFTSLLEPLIFKRKFQIGEFVLGFFIILGIVTIFGFESNYYEGIFFGLTAAFLAALFTVINGTLISRISSFTITKYEMLGGLLTISCFLAFNGQFEANMFHLETLDWLYLFILGIICTTVAFMVSVWVMKFVTPFTVSMSVNMEPIYAIIMAVMLDRYNGTHKEEMSNGFYIGASIIIASIFINAYLKKRLANRKAS